MVDRMIIPQSPGEGIPLVSDEVMPSRARRGASISRVKSRLPMASGKYFRTQAQLFAGLAVACSDQQVAARFNEMALEQLAKAEEADPGQIEPSANKADGAIDADSSGQAAAARKPPASSMTHWRR
jgi:hypothetical protein